MKLVHYTALIIKELVSNEKKQVAIDTEVRSNIVWVPCGMEEYVEQSLRNNLLQEFPAAKQIRYSGAPVNMWEIVVTGLKWGWLLTKNAFNKNYHDAPNVRS